MEKNSIQLSNLGVWLKDQLRHPWTLFKCKTWGVFSEYAHVRRSDRLPKLSLDSRVKALEVADFMSRKYGGTYSIYKCLYCDGWHVAKNQKRASISSETTNADVSNRFMNASDTSTLLPQPPIPSELNVDRLMSLDIPDIAQVYGGVRGRTLSSPKQAFAWPIVKECGIKTVIDLREDGIYTRTQELCDKYGMEYFYYPVDKELKHIHEMVSMFPKFCSLIDQGNFYIACAMGLHRTDIALCAYWVFHGADKGLVPPAIRGYRKSDGHDTDKIMRVLNAMYKEFADGKESALVPINMFNERKNVIKRQSTI